MKWNLIKTIAGLVLYATFPAVYSAPQWYFIYGFGLARPEISSSTLVDNNSGANPPYNNDTYTSSNTNNPAFLAEIGQSWGISKLGLKALSVGLQYQHYFPSDVGEHVIQYSSPDFLNYRYSLDLEANILLLNAKIELFSWKRIVPFVNFGAGVLQLIATDYTETAFSGVTARTSPDFQRNTNYQLTYQAGAGVSVELTQTLLASINYIYQPLTRFETKGGTGTWANEKLNFSDAYAHSIFITFTHILSS